MTTANDNNAAWYFEYFERNREQLLETFKTFLRFESVSTETAYREQVRACVQWLEQLLKTMGFNTEICETSTHPVLFASCSAGERAGAVPTIAIYNHYDVQPVDPIELWSSPPFEPEIREGEVYARGAQDNKGQCFYVIAALQAMLERRGSLPINVKLIIEGEEEAGSRGLHEILDSRAAALSANYLAIVDMGLHSLDRPAVTLGLRGVVTMTLTVTGSKGDLHSGLYGGAAYNPLHALVEMLAKSRDSSGKITIPGFYDGIIEPGKDELDQLDFSFDEHEYVAETGSAPTGGEKNFSPLESVWLRPTLEINGIGGGYFGSGFKTVIPGQAVAKISARLVPGQDSSRIARSIEEFFQSTAPAGVAVAVSDVVTTGGAIRTSPNSVGIRAAAQAYREVSGKTCGFILSGGSIPVVAELSKATGAEPVLIGWGLPEDNMHAPNEHFGVDRLKLGLATIARLLEILGASVSDESSLE